MAVPDTAFSTIVLAESAMSVGVAGPAGASSNAPISTVFVTMRARPRWSPPRFSPSNATDRIELSPASLAGLLLASAWESVLPELRASVVLITVVTSRSPPEPFPTRFPSTLLASPPANATLPIRLLALRATFIVSVLTPSLAW